MKYAIVVATRNRCNMLRVSVPLFLSQSFPPSRIVLVDRSDDHGAVRDLVADLAADTEIPIELIYGSAPNSAQQRNDGLERVREDIVMMPDDDTFWYPDTAREIMAVYESDTDGQIGGVAGWITDTSPLSTRDTPVNSRNLTTSRWVLSMRPKIERLLAPQPFDLYGERLARDRGHTLGSLVGDSVVIEKMGGWRMTFRTRVVRKLGFDAILGSRAGYSQHEDTDISLRVWRTGYLVVAATQAPMFHNMAPGKRSGGFTYGFLWLFNYIYLCRKLFGNGYPGRRAVERYLAYKVFLYRLRRGTHEREIYRGASVARRQLETLWAHGEPSLEDAYAKIADQCLTSDR